MKHRCNCPPLPPPPLTPSPFSSSFATMAVCVCHIIWLLNDRRCAPTPAISVISFVFAFKGCHRWCVSPLSAAPPPCNHDHHPFLGWLLFVVGPCRSTVIFVIIIIVVSLSSHIGHRHPLPSLASPDLFVPVVYRCLFSRRQLRQGKQGGWKIDIVSAPSSPCCCHVNPLLQILLPYVHCQYRVFCLLVICIASSSPPSSSCPSPPTLVVVPWGCHHRLLILVVCWLLFRSTDKTDAAANGVIVTVALALLSLPPLQPKTILTSRTTPPRR